MTETPAGSTNWVSLWEQLLTVLGSAGDSGDAGAADMQRQWSELGTFLAQQAAAALPGLIQAARAPWETVSSIFDPERTGRGAAQAPNAILWPPIGLFHKDQESAKRLQRAVAGLSDLYQQYSARLSGVLEDTLVVLIQQVKAAQAQDKRIDSARELYDLWVTSGETCFSKVAHDPDFCALQARLLNAQSELRQAQQAVMELWLKQHGLPTRTDIEALQAELASLRSRIEVPADPTPQAARTAKSSARAKSSRPAPAKARRRSTAAER